MNCFVSTRGKAHAVSAPEAVLNGIAPDGGLYIRKDFPQIAPEELLNADFCAISARILSAYLEGYTKEEIEGCVKRAYAGKFDTPKIAPIKAVGDRYVLELFHGPTAAFKDVALSILPQLTACAMQKAGRTEEILILTATSGDTGSAALTGFADVPGVKIIVFYPNEGISPIQRAQMTTMRGGNLCVCAVAGNFDDAQTGVKRIFADLPQEFRAANGFALSSANSINIGRLAPQIVYYYSAYLDLVRGGKIRMGDKVNFCVPTGNFGDILAGWYAKRMGLPIGRLICASNANRVLTDFLNTGVYEMDRDFRITISPSMDILLSSNLERLLYFSLNGDAAKVRDLMEELKEAGAYAMPEAAMRKIRADFVGYSATDAQAMFSIGEVYREHGYLMDPHTAVAWRCAEEYEKAAEDHTPCVVLATASPFKFLKSVLSSIGEKAPDDAAAQLARLAEIAGANPPAALDGVLAREARFKDVIAPADMMDYVMGKAAKA